MADFRPQLMPRKIPEINDHLSLPQHDNFKNISLNRDTIPSHKMGTKHKTLTQNGD